MKRYKAYVAVLKPKIDGEDVSSYFPFLRNAAEQQEQNNRNTLNINSGVGGATTTTTITNQLLNSPTQEHHPASNRYSYRAAIYRTEAQHDLG